MQDEQSQDKSKQAAFDKMKKSLDINTVTLAGSDEKIRHVKQKLHELGGMLNRDKQNYRYGGLAVCFVYEHKERAEVICQTMCPLLDINEVQARIMLEEMRKKLMSSFGRKINRLG